MSCDVGKATEGLENKLWRRWSDGKVGEWALLTSPTSQIILQPFRRSHVFEWHRRFSEGREEVEDDENPGRPSTSKTDQNIQKTSEIYWKERRLSVRMIADLVGIDKETVWQIIWKKWPNLWKNNVGTLHQDSAPAHNAPSVKKFLPDKRIPILEHPP